MLTRSKIKWGEGSLEEYNPKIGSRHAFQRQEMESPREENPFEYEAMFRQAFLEMKTMVEELYKE
jgi:hypothetical protein